MVSIELTKIFRRKFNYIYILLVALISSFVIYKEGYITSYLSISEDIFLYEYLFKAILITFCLLIIVNTIFNYVDDYKFKVINIIKYVKYGTFKLIISKILSNIIFFIIYSLFLIVIMFYYHKYRGINLDIMQQNVYIYYFIASIVILFFVESITLLVVSIFTNTNLSTSLVLLILIGAKFLVGYLKSINTIFSNLKYTFFELFPMFFSKNNFNMQLEIKYNNLILLLINIIVIILIVLFINKIKLRK